MTTSLKDWKPREGLAPPTLPTADAVFIDEPKISPSKGHPGFLLALETVRSLHLSKGSDYGTKQDTFANVRSSQEFGIPPWLGAVLRANDKMSRIKTAAIKGPDQLKHESLRDSLLDGANYLLIAAALLDEAEVENQK